MTARRHRRSRSARVRTPFLQRYRPWLLAGAVVAGVLLVLGIVAGLRMALVARDLRSARDLVQEASALIESGDLVAAAGRLDAASGSLVDANNTLHSSPELNALGALPVAGHNIDALRDTVTAALDLVAGGSRLLGLAGPLQDDAGRLQVPLRAGAIPVDTVQAAAQELAELATSLPEASERPDSSLLIGPVRTAVDRLFDEIDEQRPRITTLGRALALLDDLAGGNGDRRYLLAVANTAEMRGSGGMYLSYGILESSGGQFELRTVGSVDEIALELGVDPASVAVPQDTRSRWGSDVTRLWRAVNVVPDVPSIGPWAAAMYRDAEELNIDGLIQIDAAGLGAILAGVGPVDVPGLGQVTASNVVPVTLNEAYSLFPDRDQRQEVLGDVAEAVFTRLVAGDYPSLRVLAEAIVAATQRRHIVMWTAEPEAAGPLAYFHATGALPEPGRLDHSFLTVQNFSRNKLDYFVDTSVEVTGSRRSGEVGELTVEVTIANTVPEGQPPYVVGSEETGANVEPGVYYGIASLYLPVGASLDSVGGAAATEPALLSEGGRSLVGWEVLLAPGESSTVTLELSLPPPPRSGYSFQLVPLPRVRPTTWTLDIDAGGGRRLTRDGPLEVEETVVPG